jgi:AcrR family transcriptional regulator
LGKKNAAGRIVAERAFVGQKVNSSQLARHAEPVCRGDETLSPPASRSDEILAQTARCFARHGFHGVSMRDLAKVNNCSVATLYNHFPNKDALLLAIGQRLFSVIIADLRAAADAGTPGLTRLTRMMQATVADCFRYRAEFLSFTHDKRHVGLTPELSPLVELRNTCVELWRRVLTEGMQDGSVRRDVDPDATIWILVAVITGIVDGARATELAGAGTVGADMVAADMVGADIVGKSSSLISVLIDGLRPQH